MSAPTEHPSPLGPPRDEARSPKRGAILAAAIAAFCQDGFDAVSMDRIADDAGVSKRTVYNHFRSKDALFRAVVAALIERARSLKNIDWDPALPLEAQLAAFARAKLVMASDPLWSGLVRVVVGVIMHKPAFAEDATRQLEAGEDALVRWLEAAHDAGRMHVPDPVAAARLFWALAGGALFWPQLLGAKMTGAQADAVTRGIVALFLNQHRVERERPRAGPR